MEPFILCYRPICGNINSYEEVSVLNIALKIAKKIIFITTVSSIVLSCSVTTADVFLERCISDTTSSGSLPAQAEKINGSVTQPEISKLFYGEIPVPQNAKTYENNIYMDGRAPDEIINDYGNMLLDTAGSLHTR